MEQGSQAWHEWRNNGIGSSDAPVIMGVSPHKKIHTLWMEKAKKVAPKSSSFIMERGNKLEPIARAKYELTNMIEMKPATFQHFQYSFMIASMDGCNLEEKAGLEIKYCGKDDFALVQTGVVPEKYYPQVQHQLFVTGFKWIDYFSYYLLPEQANNPDYFHTGRGHCIRVYPDIPYLKIYLEKAIAFRQSVIDGVEPPIPVKKPRKKKNAP